MTTTSKSHHFRGASSQRSSENPCIELLGTEWISNTACRVPVALYPYLDQDDKHSFRALLQHLMIDGIQDSGVLYMASDMLDMSPNVVWVANVDVGPGRFNHWCNAYLEWVEKAQEQRRGLNLSTQWPIFIVDYNNNVDRIRCPKIEQAVGLEHVHYSKRSLVQNRSWNSTTNWVNVGYTNPNFQGISYRTAPYPVRKDIVQALEDELKQRNMTLSDSIETLPRPFDVVHLWPSGNDDAGEDVALVRKNAGLRTKVGDIVNQVGSDLNLSTFVGLKGEPHRSGRQSVSSEYIQTLLESKIFMVVQRDTWEDHWRLFEAMVGGSLVLTDRMLGLPLENGTHLVEFTSEQDVQNKIAYYLEHPQERLQIARQGRRMAMSNHRAWHRMEDIVFGHSVTDCFSDGASDDCPFTVKP